MGIIIKILITAVAAIIAAYFLPGVEISDIKTTIVVAIVLALLNTFLKPILVFLTHTYYYPYSGFIFIDH
jgi:putative membrane protein